MKAQKWAVKYGINITFARILLEMEENYLSQGVSKEEAKRYRIRNIQKLFFGLLISSRVEFVNGNE